MDDKRDFQRRRNMSGKGKGRADDGQQGLFGGPAAGRQQPPPRCGVCDHAAHLGRCDSVQVVEVPGGSVQFRCPCMGRPRTPDQVAADNLEGRRNAGKAAGAAGARADDITPGWAAGLRACILHHLADPNHTVAAEEIREIYPEPEGADPRCAGSTWSAMRAENLIEKLRLPGQSTLARANARPLWLWRRYVPGRDDGLAIPNPTRAERAAHRADRRARR